MSHDHSSDTMSFHSSFTDPIWLQYWVPTTEGAYLGSLIGLFVIAIIARGLSAIRLYFEAWVALPTPSDGPLLFEDNDKMRADSALTMDDDSSLSPSKQSRFPKVPPFNWKIDLMRGVIGVFGLFLGYLLMLVVMTFNVGYFFTILAGSFVGEVIFGRYSSLGNGGDDGHMHC